MGCAMTGITETGQEIQLKPRDGVVGIKFKSITIYPEDAAILIHDYRMQEWFHYILYCKMVGSSGEKITALTAGEKRDF